MSPSPPTCRHLAACDCSRPPPQIVLLIDALDEGDPPEQQVPGFKGGVMAGGNQALKLVVTCLAARLPANVR